MIWGHSVRAQLRREYSPATSDASIYDEPLLPDEPECIDPSIARHPNEVSPDGKPSQRNSEARFPTLELPLGEGHDPRLITSTTLNLPQQRVGRA